MKGKVQRGKATGRATAAADAGLVDVPVAGFAADELQGAGGVVEAGFYRRVNFCGAGVGDQAVIDRDDRDAVGEALVEEIWVDLVADHPPAAVDEEQERRV